MRETSNDPRNHEGVDQEPRRDDEGGLHAPSRLHGWQKVWWWFYSLILVSLARLRFIAILVVIGLIIMKWDTLTAYYDRWTRPTTAGMFSEHASASRYRAGP